MHSASRGSQVASLSDSRKLVPVLFILSALILIPTVFAQNSLVLTASTDKAQYAPGETVAISGKVSDNQSNPVAGASVSLQVNDPPIDILLVVSDQSGSYTDQFTLSNTSQQGVYTIYISASKAGYTTAQQQLTFTVAPQKTTSSTLQSTVSAVSSILTTSTTQLNPQTKCFIATATFGSDLAPEVILLRTFRDSEILHTSAGRSFMISFNSFYYSFSPQVASLIASSPPLRYAMKAMLYPLIGILSVSYRISTLLTPNRELGVILSGIFAALAIGIVYLGPVTNGIFSLCKLEKRSTRILCNQVAGIFCISSLLILLLGELLRIPSLLMFASVSIVLSFVFLGAASTLLLTRLMRMVR